VLPALANLACPHRLTPVWAFPNWALLPVVLFGSPRLGVTAIAAARAGMTALAVSLVAAMVSPLVARAHLNPGRTANNAHYRQIAAEISHLVNSPVMLIGGSSRVVQGLFYYLPAARPMSGLPDTQGAKPPVAARVMVCVEGDVSCRTAAASLAGRSGSVSDVAFAKTFLGYASPPLTYQIVVAPEPAKS
jgi:hypothetical protein